MTTVQSTKCYCLVSQSSFNRVCVFFFFCAGDKHRLLSQVVRPQEPSRSPPRASVEDKSSRWRDNERRGDKKDVRGRHEEAEPRADRGTIRGMERRGDHPSESSVNTPASESRRGKEQKDAITPPAPSAAVPEVRETVPLSHEEGKKKTKSVKKNLKKNRKEDEGSTGGDRFNPEPPAPSVSSVPPEAPRPLLSPPKMGKKKSLERRRKRSRGAESDQSEDEQPISKRRRGPQTPPPINKEDLPSQRALMSGHVAAAAAAAAPLKMDTNFSDWSDEEVPERTEASSERAPERLLPRRNPPLAPLLPDPPMVMHALPLQPLLPQHMLRKPQQADQRQQRSSSMGSNPSRAASRRLRSPSNDSAHRTEDSQPGPRSRRARGQGANSRDRDRERDRERERERERERVAATEPIGVREERKSRIDQLRRGEPSRSTSSGNRFLMHNTPTTCCCLCLDAKQIYQRFLVIKVIIFESSKEHTK